MDNTTYVMRDCFMFQEDRNVYLQIILIYKTLRLFVCLSDCLSVCLSGHLLRDGWSDLDETLRGDSPGPDTLHNRSEIFVQGCQIVATFIAGHCAVPVGFGRLC